MKPIHVTLIVAIAGWFSLHAVQAQTTQTIIIREGDTSKRVSGLDVRLIGKWTLTAMYHSNELVSFTQQEMAIQPDGILVLSRAISDNSSAALTQDSIAMKVVGLCRVTTEGNKIYSFDPQQNAKVLLASFVVDGDKMQTVDKDGGKQLWTR